MDGLDGSRSDPPEDGLGKQPVHRRVEGHIWRRVVSGFVVLVPLLITLWIVQLMLSVVDGLFRREDGVLSILVNGRLWDVPGIGFALTLALLYIIGAFFAGRRLQHWQDVVLTKIPIVRGIYTVARQATQALSSPVGARYRRVVFVEWPRPGVLALGFVTGQIESPGDGHPSTVAVYIPTVPNPTSGMLAWLPEDQIIETHLSVEQAMKAVFSGGIVLPESPEMAGLASRIGAPEAEEASGADLGPHIRVEEAGESGSA